MYARPAQSLAPRSPTSSIVQRAPSISDSTASVRRAPSRTATHLRCTLPPSRQGCRPLTTVAHPTALESDVAHPASSSTNPHHRTVPSTLVYPPADITRTITNLSKGSRESDESMRSGRMVGRGGSGSKPRPVSQLNVLPRSEPPLLSELYRPIGRGGLGSRQKPVEPSNPILSILPKRRPTAKGKDREATRPELRHPISPDAAYEIANGSSSTLSTLQFMGGNSAPIDFFPIDGQNIDPDDETSSRESTDVPTPTSSIASSHTGSTSPGKEDEFSDIDSENPRKRSFNKLARTLGEDVSATRSPSVPVRTPHPAEQHISRLLRDGTVPNIMTTAPGGSTKTSRRASVSLTSLSSLFVRPVRHRPSSAMSHHTMSTLTTDDLHQLNIQDDISESWGPGVDDEGESRPSGSPIFFAPPSPLPAKRRSHSSPRLRVDSDDDEDEGDDERSFISVDDRSVLSNADSVSTQRRRFQGSIVTGRGALHSTDFTPPATPNWLIPPAYDREEVIFSLTAPEEGEPLPWTGEWNRDDMQDVINCLRNLR